MKRDDPGSVRTSFGAAQRHATALGATPPAWDAGRRTAAGGPTRHWLALAVASVVLGGGGAWAWTTHSAHSGDEAPSVDALLRDAPPGAGSTGTSTSMSTSPGGTTAPDATAAIDVTRQSGLIRIALQDAPLDAAIAALAEATSTTIRGGPATLTTRLQGRRVTLRWQGTTTEVAWDRLLGRYASVAVSCRDTGCELWVAGWNGESAAPPAPTAALVPAVVQPNGSAAPASPANATIAPAPALAAPASIAPATLIAPAAATAPPGDESVETN